MKKFLGTLIPILILGVSAFASEQTKARYEKIAQELTKKPNVKIKPSMLKMKGLSLVVFLNNVDTAN